MPSTVQDITSQMGTVELVRVVPANDRWLCGIEDGGRGSWDPRSHE